jgi:hypothetical protein
MIRQGVFWEKHVASASTPIGVLDWNVEGLDIGKNEVRHGGSFDPFSSTSAVVRPSGYALRPACDYGGDWNSLFGVGGDLDQHVAR